MKLILIDQVDNLGLPGDVVTVKDGYARNYLIPHGKALKATDGNVEEMEHQKRIADSRRKKLIEDLSVRRDTINGSSVSFTENVTDGGRLYGSITSRRVADALRETFPDVKNGWVDLPEPIKEPGEFQIALNMAPDVTATVTVTVIADAVVEPEPEADDVDEDVIADGDEAETDEAAEGDDPVDSDEDAPAADETASEPETDGDQDQDES